MTGCAAPRHDGQDEPTPTEPSAHLCRPCRLGLASDLRRLPALHADLGHATQVTAGDGSGLPFSEPAAECRDQIRHDLTHWAVHITELRGLDAPPVLLPGWAERPVAVMCGWLHGQVGWCTFRGWAPDMAGAVRADAGRAWALLHPYVVKRIDIPGADGACLECDTGRLVVTVYAWSDDRRKSFIGCTECAARWEFGGAWLPFVRQVIRRRQAVAGLARPA